MRRVVIWSIQLSEAEILCVRMWILLAQLCPIQCGRHYHRLGEFKHLTQLCRFQANVYSTVANHEGAHVKGSGRHVCAKEMSIVMSCTAP